MRVKSTWESADAWRGPACCACVCTVLPWGQPSDRSPSAWGRIGTRAVARPAARRAGTAREKARGWSADEERLFLEALNAHGRDWKACAAHIGSRDVRAVTSHAQKHFIKLCLAGQRVPARVAESGEGYTLSGKPLNPGSAAARSYGLKPELLARAPNPKPALPRPRSPQGAWFSFGVCARPR